MEEKYLKKLEYDKVIGKLADHAVSAPGRALCLALEPSDNIYEIRRWQRETSEAFTLLVSRGRPVFSGLKDIRQSVERTAKGAILTMGELLDIAGLLSGTEMMKTYGKHVREDESYPCLDPIFMGLNPLNAVEREIRRCIASEEEMFDHASPKLASIRKEIRINQERVRSHLQGMLHSATYRTMLQDAVITQRNGRYCIPVKAEYKGNVPGMVHDQSGSGSTVFVEPMAVVQLNNRATELALEEEKEIRRILAELSDLVHGAASELLADLDLLVQLDFLFAKAKLALDQNAVEPVFGETMEIELKNARHPLLKQSSVVPITIYIGQGFTTLVVTGPNTGGKTVTLKTLGLLQAMGQAGLHIPASGQPKLSVLDQIFADIGDEQSIEQSLSTFSSHMVNIVEILKKVTPFSLVLFDELGAGTDPVEGAALANAILEYLRTRKILTVATTHYSELKVYALSTEGVENASCEFDVDTLQPTYRLLIGVPGKSNAFAISRRLGLSEEIIEHAGDLLESNDVQFEEMMTDLELRRRAQEEEQARIENLRKEADRLKHQVESEKRTLDDQKEAILQKAREEARDVLQKAKAEADETLREMNRLIREGQTVDIRTLEQMRTRLREEADKARKQSEKEDTGAVRQIRPEDLRPGVQIKMKGFDQICTVQQAPDNRGRLMIQAGIMKMQIKVSDVESIEGEEAAPGPKTSGGKGTSAGSFGKAQSIHLEVDLRGMTTEEALSVLDKYLDDAYLAGVPKVTVIHGKGTGVLRKACQQFLKRSKLVRSYRLGTYGEGESGVTIVEMKGH
ncbi:MAG: endonuclease MutS2 [Clostridiales bacterium]|nr:endonuclease MutS2 [Clostridiales bacterium]